MPWYHVAEPNSYLVVTGVGIEKVLIKKKVSIPSKLGSLAA
jgi:flotillin